MIRCTYVSDTNMNDLKAVGFFPQICDTLFRLKSEALCPGLNCAFSSDLLR